MKTTRKQLRKIIREGISMDPDWNLSNLERNKLEKALDYLLMAEKYAADAFEIVDQIEDEDPGLPEEFKAGGDISRALEGLNSAIIALKK